MPKKPLTPEQEAYLAKEASKIPLAPPSSRLPMYRMEHEDTPERRRSDLIQRYRNERRYRERRTFDRLKEARKRQDRPLREQVKQRVREQIIKENELKGKYRSKFNRLKGTPAGRRRLVAEAIGNIKDRNRYPRNHPATRTTRRDNISLRQRPYRGEERPNRINRKDIRDIDVERIMRKIKKARVRQGLVKKPDNIESLARKAGRVAETAGETAGRLTRIARRVSGVLPGLSIYFTVKDAMKYAHNKQQREKMRKRGVFLTPEI